MLEMHYLSHNPRFTLSRIDLRCLTIIVIITTVFIFYILIYQYDDYIFDPMKISHDLQLFISSNDIETPSNKHLSANGLPKVTIPLFVTDRVDSPYVVVGYCCRHSHAGIYRTCQAQKFVTDIAEGTFLKINKQIIYQQCTKKGTAPQFMIDPYITKQPDLPSNVTRTDKIWYIPDILLCQGYFYDNVIISHRAQLSKAERLT
eukprot:UN12328